MRGPPRKPSKLRLAEGRRLVYGDNEPEPMRGHPDSPDILRGESKREWDRILAVMDGIGLMTHADYAALVLYCHSWGRFCEAAEALAKEGSTFMTPKGYIAKNPMVTIMNEAWDQVHKAGIQFGFTPASRSRIEVKKEDKIDDLTEFIKGVRTA